jgi:hypothetical protein
MFAQRSQEKEILDLGQDYDTLQEYVEVIKNSLL